MVGLYGDRNGAKRPVRIRKASTQAATIAERCFLNRAQISWPCEAVKYASFERRSTPSSVSTTCTCGPVVSARFGLSGSGVVVIASPHNALADARVQNGQHYIRQKVQRHDGRRQKEDDRAGKLLVVRPRQRLDQQRPRLGQRQDEGHDGQFVEDAIEVEAKAVDDRAQRMARRVIPQKPAPMYTAGRRSRDIKLANLVGHEGAHRLKRKGRGRPTKNEDGKPSIAEQVFHPP